jgi:hypothetical protein
MKKFKKSFAALIDDLQALSIRVLLLFLLWHTLLAILKSEFRL